MQIRGFEKAAADFRARADDGDDRAAERRLADLLGSRGGDASLAERRALAGPGAWYAAELLADRPTPGTHS